MVSAWRIGWCWSLLSRAVIRKGAWIRGVASQSLWVSREFRWGIRRSVVPVALAFDGRPIYLPMDQTAKNTTVADMVMTERNLLEIKQEVVIAPPPCRACLRALQCCLCPWVGCCVGGMNSLFSCCMFTGVSCNSCQACIFSSLSCVAFCHCRHCFYASTYSRSCRKYCKLSAIHCLCCPLDSIFSCFQACKLCSQE